MATLPIFSVVLFIASHTTNSQNACIWGNDGPPNMIINGEYEYQGEFNGAPMFQKQITRVPNYAPTYLWRDNAGQYFITAEEPYSTTQPQHYAYCTMLTDTPWQCGLNQWRIWDEDYNDWFLHPEVYGVEGGCPEWLCHGVTTDAEVEGCNELFDTKLDRNVWSNAAGDLYWFWFDEAFRWFCAPAADYYDTDLSPSAYVRSAPEWVGVELGGYTYIDFEYPENATHMVHCLEFLQSTTTTTSVMTTTTSISQYDICGETLVGLTNLEGLTAYDFIRNHEYQQFMSNATLHGILAGFMQFGVTAEDEPVTVEHASVSGLINLTQSVCVESEDMWNLLDVMMTEQTERERIAGYIETKTVEYFESDPDVSTENLQVDVWWRPPTTTTAPPIVGIKQFPYLYITIGILAAFFLFALAAFIDARCVRKNDYFQPTSVIRSGFEVVDMVTDVLFAVWLLLKFVWTDQEDFELMIAFIASFAFIVIPITFSIFQLIRKTQVAWTKEDALANWLKEYSYVLFLFSVLTGSAYTACEIVNCGAFQLEVLSMGLNKQERIKFNAKRVIGVVLLENIPQLAIQIWYLIRFEIDVLPILSVIFSTISVMLILITVYTQWSVIKNQNTIIIGFDVTGDEIRPDFATKTNGIKNESSVILGVKRNLIEIQQPTVVPQGLRIEIQLFVSQRKLKKYNYENLVTRAVQTNKLGNIIKTEWQLSDLPRIDNIKLTVMQGRGDMVQMHRKIENVGYTPVPVNGVEMEETEMTQDEQREDEIIDVFEEQSTVQVDADSK